MVELPKLFLIFNTKMMRTGQGDDSGALMESYMKSVIDIIQPVLEQSVILAAEYSKACGRYVVLPEDVQYALKYCAMNLVGRAFGSIAPEVYEMDSDSDDMEVDDENCPQFVRYSGDDPKYISMNDAYDGWNDWVPQNPTEELLKNTINSNEHLWARGVDILRG